MEPAQVSSAECQAGNRKVIVHSPHGFCWLFNPQSARQMTNDQAPMTNEKARMTNAQCRVPSSPRLRRTGPLFFRSLRAFVPPCFRASVPRGFAVHSALRTPHFCSSFTPHSALRTPHFCSSFTPHSALRTPHFCSSFTPHSALRTPHLIFPLTPAPLRRILARVRVTSLAAPAAEVLMPIRMRRCNESWHGR
jgi:hypothetical protein